MKLAAALVAVLAAFPAPPAMRFEFATKPFVDLHFYVRSLASSKAPRPEAADVEGLAEAVQAARDLDAELGSPIAWGYVEGLIGDCATAHDGTLAMAKTRKTVEMLGGKNIELRAGAMKLAAALEKVEPAFLEKVWPAHRKAIEDASERITKGFDGKGGACLADVAKHLGLPSGDRTIPVRLVYEEPFPGAVTHRKPGGGGVCFVSVKDVEGTELLESVLHEATHALDVLGSPAPGEQKPRESASEKSGDDDSEKGSEGKEKEKEKEKSDKPPKKSPPKLTEKPDESSADTTDTRSSEDPATSVLDLLRARLEKAGFTRRDPEWRNVPHTLMFVQAGETIRRIVDSKHEHYGVTAKYYDKVRAIADVELAAWTAYLDGKTTRDAALERILASVRDAKTPR
jgi:hypothetical protein